LHDVKLEAGEPQVVTLLNRFYQLLMALAGVSMLGAFVSIGLGVSAREFHWDIQGLDAYAGYCIAGALFLALPGTLQQGDHIRVSLLINRLGIKGSSFAQYLCLIIAIGLSGYLAWFSCRMVWVSYTTHDVSPAADATALWIPQISMALGCIGLAVAFAHALFARIAGQPFFKALSSTEVTSVE
jgi:TRAP-type C4-dicarboxylate transport system permease small subunit